MAGINKPIVGVAAAVIVIAASTIYYFRSRHALPPVPAAPAAVEAPAADAEPAIEHPLPAAADGQATATSVPDLKDSDAPLRDALARLVGVEGVGSYLRPEDLVRNMVVTIDNLPRQKVAVQKRPTTPVAGSFQVNGDELHATDRKSVV